MHRRLLTPVGVLIMLMVALPASTQAAGSQTYSAPGSYTFTVPSYTGTLTVEVWGGGQHSDIWSIADFWGDYGGASSFNGTVVANGGGGGNIGNHPVDGGTASGGDVNVKGNPAIWQGGFWASGGNAPYGGQGGFNPTQSSTPDWNGIAPGGGGGCQNGSFIVACVGGGSGGYAKKTYTAGQLTAGASIPVVVGAGGFNANNYGGGNGGNGKVAIVWTDSTTCSLPWGGSIANGASVTAYQSSTVPYGSSCASQTRTCSNGTLSGSYTSQTCSVGAPPSVSCTLSTSPSSIVAGSSATLAWGSAGTPDAFYISSVGWVGASGSTSVAPNTTTTYSGTVYKCPVNYTINSSHTCTSNVDGHTMSAVTGSCSTTLAVTCSPTYSCTNSTTVHSSCPYPSGSDTTCGSGTQCVPGQATCQCAPSYSCVNQTTSHSTCPLPSGSNTACGTGQICSSSSGTCVSAPTTVCSAFGGHTGCFEARPKLVPVGRTSTLYWNLANAASCTVTSSPTGTVLSGTSSGTSGKTTTSITSRTTFTLTCVGLDAQATTSQAVIDIAPTYLEH